MVKIAVPAAIFIIETLTIVACFPSYGLHQDSHFTLNGGGGLGSYGQNGGYPVYQHKESPIINNDHHGGVSVVGAGGSGHKGTTIDLTKEGGGGHDGLFGGSFISSGKHGSYLQGHEGYGGDDLNVGLGAYHQSYHAAGEVTPVHYSSQYSGGEHGNLFAPHNGDQINSQHKEFSGLMHQESSGNYNFGGHY